MATKYDYQMAEINTRDIYIDELGQRDVNRRRAQFNKIMRTFDPNLVQPISVALIDGKYYCFDGQMTIKVLKEKNARRDLCVKCRVYTGMSKKDAADMFIKQRGTSSNVTMADKIRVLGNYGDKKSLYFQRITEKNGLEISWNGTKAKNAVTAVSTLWNEFKEFDDYDLYGSYVRVLKKSWGGTPSSLKSGILRGLGLFMRTYKMQHRENDLISRLSKINPDDIIRAAQNDRSTGARKYAVQILFVYNYKRGNKSRLPYLL